jgi:hypothetical protein
MKGLTVGEMIDYLNQLMERGDISRDDKMALVSNHYQVANPVASVIPMTGFVDANGGFEFRGELDPKETRRLVFVYGD